MAKTRRPGRPAVDSCYTRLVRPLVRLPLLLSVPGGGPRLERSGALGLAETH